MTFRIPRDARGLTRSQRERLRKAVEKFARHAKRERWHTIGGSANMCTEAADDFLWCLDEFGLTGRIEHYSFSLREWSMDEVQRDSERYPFETDECRFHWAVRLGENLIIDWTARQFDEDADFPAVWVDDTPRDTSMDDILDNQAKSCESAAS